ncbi:hypothetical protein C8Q77DRAFT_1157868 [Trametes polyzona]|nr:hypothetical protein C8Q77DRAFT_1157868 [Trametes polyzona]
MKAPSSASTPASARKAGETSQVFSAKGAQPKRPWWRRDVSAGDRNALWKQLHEQRAEQILEEVLPEPKLPELDPATVSRRGRVRKLPAKLVDHVPSGHNNQLPAHLRVNIPQAHPISPRAASEGDTVDVVVTQSRAESPINTPQYVSDPDDFGIYHVFPIKPKRLPDPPSLDDLCEGMPLANGMPITSLAAPLHAPSGLEKTTAADRPPYAPFPNYSTFALFQWQNNDSSSKSNAQMDDLAELMQHPDFRSEDVAGFSAARESRRLDEYFKEDESSPLSPRDGWKRGSVKIRVPKEGVSHASEDDAPEFTVEGLYHRSLVEVIDAAYHNPSVKGWHIIPSRVFWLQDALPINGNTRPSSDIPRSPSLPAGFSPLSSSASSDTSVSIPEGPRVYGEAYHADAILDEDAAMRARPREAGDPDDLEYVIAPIGLWSDSTHLTSFGSAKLWPVYAYVLSQSKYIRGKPTAFAAHHIAYMPSLPDTIQDWYIRVYGIAATAAVLTFLKRELMQEIWLLLMDEQFMYAYIHGLIIACGDGVRRRMFIRFLLYAADYPEKMLLACLKYFARCPCPRCRINKDKIIEMGTTQDLYRRNWIRVDNDDVNHRIGLARKWIFQHGMSLTSIHISRLLDPLSITPSRSAFSTRLRPHGFNFYSLFVPDLLHEFKLGVWKSIFTHILRLLHAVGNDAIQEFNKRFRQIPTFGRSTIRRFSSNISDQGKLAARDYEARAKCIMPAIEGLMPCTIDNDILLDLSFDAAAWQALGKLREHTDHTISGLDVFTVEFGKSVRLFSKKTCAHYVTVELPKEAAARGRRTAALAGTTTVRKVKTFNLTTYKLHAMRDYPGSIRDHGSTDNNSTQVGELEHKHAKRFYTRTNKVNFQYQIAQLACRSEKLKMIRTRVDAATAARKARTTNVSTASTTQETSEDEAPTSAVTPPVAGSSISPTRRYHIAKSLRVHDEVTSWLREQAKDPALADFVPNLKDHLLARRAHQHGACLPEAGFTRADRARISFVNNKIYWHQVLRVNYTTYDQRRAQDSINPRTRADVMLLAPAGRAHQYMYARIIKIFHVNLYSGDTLDSEDVQRVDVLFVRWFDVVDPGGFGKKRLPRIEFISVGDPNTDAFGFIDPADVIRGAHILPSFSTGRTHSFLGPSLARDGAGGGGVDPNEVDTDWSSYYVNL